MNRVTLLGRLGRDPEVRRLGNGNSVVNLRLATSESWKDKATGERKEKTEWHSVVIYNEHLGKIAEQYARKGGQLLIEGALQTRKWQDNDGKDRYATEVILGQFNGTLTLLAAPSGDRGATDPDASGSERTREERRPAPASTGGGRGGYDLDDDIPF